METFKISTAIILTIDEKTKLENIISGTGLCLSAVVLKIADATAVYLKRGSGTTSKAGPPIRAIIRCALDLYRPFSCSIKEESINISYNVNYSFNSLKERLNSVGILKVSQFLRSIVLSIIEHPTEASRVKLCGFYTKSNSSVSVTIRAGNGRIDSHFSIPEDTYNLFYGITKANHTTISEAIRDVMQSLCAMEFETCEYFKNENILKKCILLIPRNLDIDTRKVFSRKKVRVYINNLRLSVQARCIVDKYGIPSITDLMKRIIDFIISANIGNVKLNAVITTDDSDYNETRMIRNEFRKEVLYETSR